MKQFIEKIICGVEVALILGCLLIFMGKAAGNQGMMDIGLVSSMLAVIIPSAIALIGAVMDFIKQVKIAKERAEREQQREAQEALAKSVQSILNAQKSFR